MNTMPNIQLDLAAISFLQQFISFAIVFLPSLREIEHIASAFTSTHLKHTGVSSISVFFFVVIFVHEA
jgi:hypothetical protein